MNRTDLPLTPEARALEGADGVPLAVGTGQTWLLADGGLDNILDGLRDRIDDQARLEGSVPLADVGEAAWTLLRANYLLGPGEAEDILLAAEPAALCEAVMEALFGAKDLRRTYTTWASSAFLANGLDPAAIPWRMRPHVLNQLVGTGRAIPLDKYVESAVAAPQLAAFRARAARTTPQATAEAAAS